MAIPDPRHTALAVSGRKTPVENAYCNLVSTVTAAPAASIGPPLICMAPKHAATAGPRGVRGVREEDEITISYRIQALVEYLTTLQD